MKVRAEQVQYSRASVGALSGRLRDLLTSMGVGDFAVAFDPGGQRLIASINSVGTPVGAQLTAASIAARLPGQFDAMRLDVQVGAGQVARSSSVYGGTDGGNTSDAYWCTTAFTVTSGAANGIASDGHCGTMPRVRDWVTGEKHSMSLVRSHIGGWGDFEWLTTTGIEVDDFYADEAGSRRDVTGVTMRIDQGKVFSWFGRTSRNDWTGSVAYPWVSTSGPGNLACFGASHVIGGDSGGPVYVGGSAVGLVWGWVLIDGARRDCLSRADYIDDALGVSILR